MNKEIKKLENCLKAMKKCLKISKVESCICFSDAFKVLDLEVNKLQKKIDRRFDQDKEELAFIKEEIEKIKENISQGNKECLGCNPCIASVIFNEYPDMVDALCLDDKL